MIVSAIAGNATLKSAAGRAGIAYGTFQRWMSEGREDETSQFRQFYEAVIRAEDEAQVNLAALWTLQCATDWRAARDLLARRHPEEWGVRIQQEHRGTITSLIQIPNGTAPAAYLRSLVLLDEGRDGDDGDGDLADD